MFFSFVIQLDVYADLVTFYRICNSSITAITPTAFL